MNPWLILAALIVIPTAAVAVLLAWGAVQLRHEDEVEW